MTFDIAKPWSPRLALWLFVMVPGAVPFLVIAVSPGTTTAHRLRALAFAVAACAFVAALVNVVFRLLDHFYSVALRDALEASPGALFVGFTAGIGVLGALVDEAGDSLSILTVSSAGLGFAPRRTTPHGGALDIGWDHVRSVTFRPKAGFLSRFSVDLDDGRRFSWSLRGALDAERLYAALDEVRRTSAHY